jgi:hypothetical protein
MYQLSDWGPNAKIFKVPDNDDTTYVPDENEFCSFLALKAELRARHRKMIADYQAALHRLDLLIEGDVPTKEEHYARLDSPFKPRRISEFSDDDVEGRTSAEWEL